MSARAPKRFKSQSPCDKVCVGGRSTKKIGHCTKLNYIFFLNQNRPLTLNMFIIVTLTKYLFQPKPWSLHQVMFVPKPNRTLPTLFANSDLNSSRNHRHDYPAKIPTGCPLTGCTNEVLRHLICRSCWTKKLHWGRSFWSQTPIGTKKVMISQPLLNLTISFLIWLLWVHQH